VVPTTSHPSRPSRSRVGNTSQSSPLKGILLKVTITGPNVSELMRLAASKGLNFEEKGGDATLVISAPTPEEALAKLGVLSALLSSKA
jgi:hypothetical protein